MIVKVQKSLTLPLKVLIYDKSRRVYREESDPSIVNKLVAKLGKDNKAYFNAKLVSGQIVVGEKIKPLNW